MDKTSKYINSGERRSFLKNGLRALMLGAIALMSGFLGWRKANTVETERFYCPADAQCGSCGKLPLCSLPKAEDAISSPAENR